MRKRHRTIAAWADPESLFRGGPHLTTFFFFLLWGDPNTTKSGPPKWLFACVPMTAQHWLGIFVIFGGSGSVFLRNPISCDFSGVGGSGPTVPLSLWIRAWPSNQPSLSQQNDCKTKNDTKYCIAKQGSSTQTKGATKKQQQWNNNRATTLDRQQPKPSGLIYVFSSRGGADQVQLGLAQYDWVWV